MILESQGVWLKVLKTKFTLHKQKREVENMRKVSKNITNTICSKIVIITCLLLIFLNITYVNATTYTFSGTVTQAPYWQPSDSYFPPPVSLEDTYTGYFSYFYQQTPVPVHVNDPTSVIYGSDYNLNISYAVYFSSLTVYGASTSFKEIDIMNDTVSNINPDVFQIIDTVPVTIPYPIIADNPGSFIDEAWLYFADSTGTIINNTDLPNALNFNSFDTCRLWLVGATDGPGVSLSITGNIDNIHELLPVPEPANIILIGVGFGGIIFLRKKTLKQ